MLCLALFGLLAVSAAGQSTSPQELRERVTMALARGDFFDAIPDIEQLIGYLGESDNTRVVASMETIFYHLGICQFFTGEFAPARKAFEEYLRRYRHGTKRADAGLYIADAIRLGGDLEGAIRQYRAILKDYSYDNTLLTDIYSSLARCHMAREEWSEAIEALEAAYKRAPDVDRRSWAATLLATAYFKSLQVDKIYGLTPVLLERGSAMGRSVAFNLSAIEAGDTLFAEERYREAMWVFRMVFPYEQVVTQSETHLSNLNLLAERSRGSAGDPRGLMRIQETIGELEAAIASMREIEDYDDDLYYRLARGYMELRRLREGRTLFLHLHERGTGSEAEEALYYAFQCSLGIEPWDRAFEIGRRYMALYPAGEYYDPITIVMGQMHARQLAWPVLIDHLTGVLKVRTNHAAAGECMFLIGYASFMEEDFAAAVTWFGRVLERFPDTPLREELTYWTGMSRMFDRQYEQAALDFDEVMTVYPDGPYVEDAAYRRAACDYGLSRMEAADERLRAFLERYPGSKLMGEAAMMRGDIAGALGRLDDAVAAYQMAMSDAGMNAEYYNHCAFQSGRILADEERYNELIDHFTAYIETDREGANIPQAIYWIGVARWNSGQEAEALRYYQSAVERFGNEADRIGIDMILNEWVSRVQRSSPERARAGWRDLHAATTKAIAEKQITLALRLGRVLLYDPDLHPARRERLLGYFQAPAAIAAASPGTLEYMLEYGRERGDDAFVARVAERIVEAYPETDYALDARMALARLAVDAAAGAGTIEEAGALREQAVAHLTVIKDVFATSEMAGQAWLLLGAIHAGNREYEKAEECYTSVLGVKSWRSLWPEALYGMGETHYQRRRFDQAAAFYERIYVMYAHHLDWTAKAYWRRADCLERLRRPELAREVLSEMVALDGLDPYPETALAREFLASRQGS